MNNTKKIEAVLFYKGEPVSRHFLSKALNINAEELEKEIESLKQAFVDRGVVLVETEDEISIGISPEISDFIESISNEEIEKELTPAALETLSIILYRNPISRAEIDFIRGVNSAFIVRNLLVRGLVERSPDPKDKRSYVYKPSIKLLSHLGVSNIEEIPKYSEVSQKIDNFYHKTSSDSSEDVSKESQ